MHRVSCATGEGIDELKRALFALCPGAPRAGAAPAAELPEFLDYRPRAARAARVSHPPHRPRLPRRGPAARRATSSKQALRAAGVRRGALVEIGDEELEWQP